MRVNSVSRKMLPVSVGVDRQQRQDREQRGDERRCAE